MNMFASDPLYVQEFEGIDAEAGIIRGVKICSEGDARGHDLYLNKQFIRDVASQGKAHQVGIKARFGHPNMCSTALGTYIGRYRNFRTRSEQAEGFTEGWDEFGKPRKSGNRLHAVADLHLDDTAKNLPKLGNTWDYIMNLARTSPDMFGNSIVFKGRAEMKEWEEEDESGQKVKKQRRDAILELLVATDLVDSPAATDGLFQEFSTDEMAIQVTQFLDQHPEVYQLAVDHPELIEQFMTRYADYKAHQEDSNNPNVQIMTETKSEKNLLERLKGLISSFASGGDQAEAQEEATEEATEEASEEVAAEEGDQGPTVEERLNEITARQDELAEQNSQLEAQVAELTSQVEERDARVTELEAQNTELQTQLSQANGQSTQVGATAGQEDREEAQLSDEEKALAADLASLRGEMTEVRPDLYSQN